MVEVFIRCGEESSSTMVGHVAGIDMDRDRHSYRIVEVIEKIVRSVFVMSLN